MTTISEERLDRLKAAARRGASAGALRAKMMLRPAVAGALFAAVEAPISGAVVGFTGKWTPVAVPAIAALVLAQREPQAASGLAFMAGYRLVPLLGIAGIGAAAPAAGAAAAPGATQPAAGTPEAAALMSGGVREQVRRDVAALMGGDRYRNVNPNPNERPRKKVSSALSLVG